MAPKKISRLFRLAASITLFVFTLSALWQAPAQAFFFGGVSLKDEKEMADLMRTVSIANILHVLKGKAWYETDFQPSGQIHIVPSTSDDPSLIKDSIIILRNSPELQRFSIINHAAVIIVCGEDWIDNVTLEMAQKEGVSIMHSSLSVLECSRLIFECPDVSQVATRQVICFYENETVEEVSDRLAKTRFRTYPVLNEDKQVVAAISRYHLFHYEKKRFILMDHNEAAQSVNDLSAGIVSEIVDHHRIGDIETSRPISFRNMIIGSTCSIVTMMYREANIRMSDKVALLCAYGMISDTLNFHSPTTTPIDLDLKAYLEKEYGLHFDEMAKELFENTATIKGKEFKNLLYNDTKEYILSGHRIDISQVFTYNLDDVDSIEEDFKAFMEQENKKRHYDLLMMVFTNVEGNGSRFICVGDLAHDVAPAVARFADQQFVSRKKQIVPSLAQVLL